MLVCILLQLINAQQLWPTVGSDFKGRGSDSEKRSNGAVQVLAMQESCMASTRRVSLWVLILKGGAPTPKSVSAPCKGIAPIREIPPNIVFSAVTKSLAQISIAPWFSRNMNILDL